MKNPTPIDLQNSTLLVVDDEAMGLMALVEYLESAGFEVVTAKDGEEGFQRAVVIQPDLILLDVMMPGIDGFETCRRLKANTKTAATPVILKTCF